MTKYLIINADDFGMSKVFNDVILDLIGRNLVRSTTVMVNRIIDDQKEQVDNLIDFSKNKNLSVGLHLEFENKNYLSQIKSEYRKFREIFGFDPSHVDIHKSSTHEDSIIIVADFCRENSLACRNWGKNIDYYKSTDLASFHGSIEDFGDIEKWINVLEDDKFYEILFHPGRFDPDCKSSLNKERERDVGYIEKLNLIAEDSNIRIISYLDLVASY